jgi:hypothetical protein|tara:strand:+ start:376 stop:1038 length:663 start_codon:yes stop_codon:yes gene_type:complete
MKLFITLLATLFLFTACKEKPAEAADSNWTKSEHNYNVQNGDYGLNIRTYYRSDYMHVEPSYTLGKKWYGMTAAVRIAEEDGAREYRPKLTHQIINWSPGDTTNEDGTISKSNTEFWVGHRVEFRNYENESTDDYWRYRIIGKVAIGLGDKLSVWGQVQPRWTFGQGQEEDTKIEDIRNQVGIKINLDNNMTFSPYVEIIADKDMKQQSAMVGTALSFKF